MNIRLLLFFSAFVLMFSACQNVERESSVDTQNFTTAPNSNADSLKEERADKTNVAERQATNVWVCKSAGAKKYHFDRNCGGLGKCTHKIEQMGVGTAEAVGLSKCRYKKCK